MSIDVRRFLADQGCPQEVIDRATAEGRLAVLVLDHLILPGERCYTADQVAARVDVPREVSNRLWRAMGFPDADADERAFSDTDVTALKQALAPGLGEADLDLLVQQTRVVGAATARVAEAVTDAIVRGFSDLAAAGADQDEIAATLADTFDIDRLGRLLDYVHRRQLLAAMRRRLVGAGVEGRDARVAVGFADLAGFTAISQQLGMEELTVLINRFEASSRDLVAGCGGRVVKSIGDEIMFVADDPADAADIALTLVELHDGDDVLPPLKVGLDTGEALVLDGDYFGPVVNRASRITELARAGTALASPELRATLEGVDRFRWSDVGRKRIKDIGSTHLWRLRRSRADGEDDDEELSAREAGRRAVEPVAEVVGGIAKALTPGRRADDEPGAPG
ncbi:hypothetical protein BH20ACT2_BH20ACT2_19450 [soil metagenome]